MSGLDLTYLILNSSNQCISSLYLPSSPMSLVLNIISITHGETELHQESWDSTSDRLQSLFIYSYNAILPLKDVQTCWDASSGSEEEYVSVERWFIEPFSNLRAWTRLEFPRQCSLRMGWPNPRGSVVPKLLVREEWIAVEVLGSIKEWFWPHLFLMSHWCRYISTSSLVHILSSINM